MALFERGLDNALRLNKKLVIVSLLYFAEGFPLGLIEQALPVYFRMHGMSLVNMGLLSLLSLPYALKFIWAPAVDFLGTRRRWIAGTQLCMAAAIFALVPLNPSDPSFLLWVCVASLAIFSATQDIAVDAYSIEMLDPPELGLANGVRMAAYRVALLVAGGVFVALGGWIGWKPVFLACAGLLAACAVISFRLPPVEVQRPRFSITSLKAPVRDLFTRPGIMQVALFLILYKVGDMAMGPMVRPFWLERGLSTTEIGLITGTFGVLAGIAGGLCGGLFMVRFGIFRGLWFLGIWQCLSNLSYAWVAADPGTGHWGIYVASMVESFCGGLGTAAFLAFMMSMCRKEFSATQYAILSALYKISGIVAGTLSGWATNQLGYASYFAFTFFLSIPAFFFISSARELIPEDRGGKDSEDSAVAMPMYDEEPAPGPRPFSDGNGSMRSRQSGIGIGSP